MGFLYETHLHTSPASACASTSPQDYVELYKQAGFSGIVVTNHFFNGNCGIDRSLPWKEKVRLYCDDYNQMKKSAEGMDFDVLFGVEYNFQGDEYLLFGIDELWLYDHPEIMLLTHQELFDTIDKIGGLMIQAHPYRMRSYIKEIHLHPECVHGIEVYNSGNHPDENDKALLLAQNHNLLMTSGSDMHDVSNIIRYINDKSFLPGGVILSERAKSMQDFIRILKQRNHKVLN